MESFRALLQIKLTGPRYASLDVATVAMNVLFKYTNPTSLKIIVQRFDPMELHQARNMLTYFMFYCVPDEDTMGSKRTIFMFYCVPDEDPMGSKRCTIIFDEVEFV